MIYPVINAMSYCMTYSPQKLHNNLNTSKEHSVLSPLLRDPQGLPSAAAGRQQKQNVSLPWHCTVLTARGLVFEIKRTFTIATKP